MIPFTDFLVLCLLEYKDVVHYELLEHGRTITLSLYFQQLDRVNKALLRKCSFFRQYEMCHSAARVYSEKKNPRKCTIYRMVIFVTFFTHTRFNSYRFSFVLFTMWQQYLLHGRMLHQQRRKIDSGEKHCLVQ